VFPRYCWCDSEFDPRHAAALAAHFELPLPVAGVLAARGLTEPAAAASFLDPRLQQLGDPLAFPGMTAAAERIARAIAHGEPMVVFGDFDADGVIAASVLTSAIRALGGRVTPFLPDRFIDGYGLTRGALVRCLAALPDTRLLITVDCGITARDEAAYLATQGCDLIVTDHHEPDGDVPVACAVVNPRLPDTPDGAAGLCGAGVAFKLVHALVKRGKQAGLDAAQAVDPRIWLDAVAVATVADVVPLRGENRVLVAAGLRRLRDKPHVGLKALMHRAGTPDTPTSHHLAFILGPRLNAAGRMLDAWPAYNLLQAGDWDAALSLAVQLEQLNAQRKQVEAGILAAACRQLGTPDPGRAPGGVVAGGADWHPGAIGIVASRLSELWNRPAAVVALDPDGAGRGSVRAGRGYDARAALKACGDTLAGSGGHRQAAGFRLKAGALEAFRDAFDTACAGQRPPESDGRPMLTVDGWFRTGGEDLDGIWRAQQRLEPFGEGHARPRWGLRGARVEGEPALMGSQGEHLRLAVALGGRNVRVVGWKMGPWLEPLRAAGKRCDLAVELAENRWNGETSIEFQLVDARRTPGPA